MKKLACTLILTLATLHLVAATDSPPKPVAAAGETTDEPANASAATIELKNRSSFVVDGSSRNPFWPIGWKPAVKQTSPGEQSGPEISPAAFLVSSIMTGEGARYAIINGKPMQEGQVFGLQAGTQVYQITVKTIEDGQVILQRRDQEFAVPLRRK